MPPTAISQPVGADESTLTKMGNKMKIKNASSSVTGGELLYLDDAGEIQQLDAGTSGQLLQTAGDGEAPTWTNTGNIITGKTERTQTYNAGDNYYCTPNGATGNDAQFIDVSTLMPQAGTLSNLYVECKSNTLSSGLTVTVYKNNAATDLTVSLANTVLTSNNTSDTVSYVAGDEIAVFVDAAAGTGSATEIKWGFLA